MERSEPTLVPEWLKSSGNLSGGGNTAHQFAFSSLRSEDQGLLKSRRNGSSGNTSDNDLGRTSVSDRTTSSYFRRTPSSNGSAHSRSYSSFGGRSNRDREWDRDSYDFRDKDKSALSDHRHRDYSDPLENILPSRFEKDRLRRSHSSISAKRSDSWPRKTAAESSNASKSNHSNGNALLKLGGSSVHKASFEKDFPSLGAEERRADPEIGRVPSPGLTAIQSLPIGNSSVIGGDGWTSALAEVPVIVASNGSSAASVQQAVNASSVSVASSATTGRNMAETLAQGPPRVQTAPQLSVGTQRLEELAVKQSRQLIPVTPSLPKALNLNPSDKPKLKLGQQQLQNSHIVNNSPRGVPVKTEVSKIPSLGKLQVLKPARDRNGITPTAKDSLSPTSSSSKLPSSPLSNAPSVAGSAPFKNPSNNPLFASAVILEKRPTLQAQSRNDFFKSMRKKSLTNSSSAAVDSGSSVSACDEPTVDNRSETEAAVSASLVSDEPTVDRSGVESIAIVLTSNGNTSDGVEHLSNGNNHLRYSEEKEVELLFSMGWEPSAGEDEGLTEEEINDFCMTHGDRFPKKILKGGQQQSS